MSYTDKVILAEQFAEAHSKLNKAIRTEYDKEWDAFIVHGYTNMDRTGQYTITTMPYHVYVWVSDYGMCTFTKPPRYPWGENPNDI
jgi:hypothetical protein